MKIYDITHSLSTKLPCWDNNDRAIIKQTSNIKSGDVCNVTHIFINSHYGTHIDAPSHFIDDAKTIDKISLETLVGKVRVVDVSKYSEITLDVIKKLNLEDEDRVLFKTNSGNYMKVSDFKKDYVSLTLEAAKHLVDIGIKLIGIDYLSIESYDTKNYDVHKLLLNAEIVIIEGLKLDNIIPGDYDLVALPMKIENCDGAPTRAILIERCS